jgi:pyruvate,water dikinase
MPKGTLRDESLRRRYDHFKDLLASNAELLDIITDIEQKLNGWTLFDLAYIRTRCTLAVGHARRMVDSLNAIADAEYAILHRRLDLISAEIDQIVGDFASEDVPDLTLPYSRIHGRMASIVGGKNANLGELVNALGAPVAEGFAITVNACRRFLSANTLAAEISRGLEELDFDDPTLVEALSEDIQRRVLTAPVPPDVAAAILEAYDHLFPADDKGSEPGRGVRVSMRSSAVGEDGALSFAGQYRSVLNVTRDKLLEAFRYVVGSLFSARAITYRHLKGIREAETAMGVACMKMVDAIASGVAYSRDPLKAGVDSIIISAVWGLGPSAVDGTHSPDTYKVARNGGLAIIEQDVACKSAKLVAHPDGGLVECPVPAEARLQPCLSESQVLSLAAWAARLEAHFKTPQDLEWALASDNSLLLLQARPLRPVDPPEHASVRMLSPGREALMHGGATAFPGVARGVAFHVRKDEDLLSFPKGAILIAKHSSPKYMVVMQKAAAIVTDVGSITGHMASLCREFAVPCLLGTKTATQLISHGAEITVDAGRGRIYLGGVPELAAMPEPPRPFMKDSPAHTCLLRAAAFIAPLNLLDPAAIDFAAERCATLHDIARFVHERSYGAMFRLGALAAASGRGAVRLIGLTTLDLHIIDLGGGLSVSAPAGKSVGVESVVSPPLKALLGGLIDVGIKPPARPVAFSGFLSVMREQMLASGDGTEMLGGRSYAIVSDKYLNFSSRIGYHYSVLDCYCGRTLSKNYITFLFKGGAADDIRRMRRARAIAGILEAFDFNVDIQADRVMARFQKYDADQIAARLSLVGRMLAYTRQMDMLMTTEESVGMMIRDFLDRI